MERDTEVRFWRKEYYIWCDRVVDEDYTHDDVMLFSESTLVQIKIVNPSGSVNRGYTFNYSPSPLVLPGHRSPSIRGVTNGETYGTQ